MAVAAIATLGVVTLAHHAGSAAADPGLAGVPSYPDFVAGTDLDETLQETVASHLPGIPPATEVYPSDWNHAGPIPDADYADATEWHAVYQVSAREKLTTLMSQEIPGQPVLLRCDAVEQAGLPCRRIEGPDGSVEMQFGTVIGGSTYRFLTIRVAHDGFITETLDDVQAQSWPEADAARQLSGSATSALVQDPALRFPAPVQTPPSPAPQM